MSPFLAHSLERPPRPTREDGEAWDAYAEELSESIAAYNDFENNDFGPQVLAVKSGARGSSRWLQALVGSRGSVKDARGNTIAVRHGFRDGLKPEELFACTVGAREALGEIARQADQRGYGIWTDQASTGFGVIARAMRTKRPGMVFARTAAREETDPLTDVDSRLFVGLPVERHS